MEKLLSIGDLAAATGIPAATLRTWEARYGFPEPRRRPSGHRRYDPATVDRLRLIQAALARGVRPGHAVPASRAELEALVAEPEVPAELATCLACVERGDGPGLEEILDRTVTRVGARELISGLAVPLLQEVGDRYARGELAVWQEHLASARLREVLARIWRPLSDRAADAPVLVLATLPEELHDLGLHMAATWLCLAGYRIAFLGADTPVAEIAATTRSLHARGVVIASSPAAPVEQVRVHLAELRERLPARVPLLVGGTEATSAGVRRLDSLEDLDSLSWSRAH